MAIAAAKSLSALRMAIGVIFLIFAEYKVFGTQFTRHGGFQYWINLFIAGDAYPFMLPLLRSFVLPHATSIAFLVAYGELAIGLSLVLGIMVRAASACAALYMLALLFSANYPGSHAAFWQYFGASLDHSILVLCFATFALTRTEEHYSVRRVLVGAQAKKT
jgi:thiosulfate dehydrogenase (quinone) large subunit